MRSKVLFPIMLAVLLVAQSSFAAILAHNTTYTFTFSNPANNITGDDLSDVATGVMKIHSVFDGTNTTFLTTISNTSPTQNPAITAFGFDTTPADALTGLVSWSMSALKWDPAANGGLGALVPDTALADHWSLTNSNNGQGNVDLHDGSGNVQYGLYNPAVAPPGGGEANDPRYTLATLIVTLAGDVHALYNTNGLIPDSNEPSPYIRLQNTGRNGNGSLKLNGTLQSELPDPKGGPQDGDVPEPATLAIWSLGLGVAGLVRLARRNK